MSIYLYFQMSLRRPGAHLRLERRIGTINDDVARFCERHTQLWLEPHDLAPFASPGTAAPHIGRYVLVEAIGVADDEQAVVPCDRQQR